MDSTPKHWSPELVRGVPTAVSICKLEAPPNKLGTPTGEAFFNGILLTEAGGGLGEAPRVTGETQITRLEACGRNRTGPFLKC